MVCCQFLYSNQAGACPFLRQFPCAWSNTKDFWALIEIQNTIQNCSVNRLELKSDQQLCIALEAKQEHGGCADINTAQFLHPANQLVQCEVWTYLHNPVSTTYFLKPSSPIKNTHFGCLPLPECSSISNLSSVKSSMLETMLKIKVNEHFRNPCTYCASSKNQCTMATQYSTCLNAQLM